MIIAIVKGGVVVPRDPLPLDWQDGTEVEVERIGTNGIGKTDVHPTDAWMDEVEAIAAQGDVADDRRLDEAIQNVRRREKELARKKLEANP